MLQNTNNWIVECMQQGKQWSLSPYELVKLVSEGMNITSELQEGGRSACSREAAEAGSLYLLLYPNNNNIPMYQIPP